MSWVEMCGELSPEAIDDLGSRPGPTANDVPALRAAVHDLRLAARSNAIDGLAQLGPIAADAVPDLIDVLDADPTKRVADALVRVTGGEPWLVDLLLDTCLRNDADGAPQACAALAGMGLPALPAIRRLLRSSEPNDRCVAARMMGRGVPTAWSTGMSAFPQPEGLEAAGDLKGLLADSNSTTRSDAALVLSWQAYIRDEPALELETLLRSDDTDTRLLALGLLPGVGRLSAQAVPDVLTLLRDPDVKVRRGAADLLSMSLSEMGSLEPDAEIVRALVGSLDDTDSSVRSSSTIALQCCGLLAAPALPRLTRMLDEGDAPWKSTVVNAIGAIGVRAAPIAPRIYPYLSATDPSLRRFTASTLGLMGPEAVAPVIDELAVLADGPYNDGLASAACLALLAAGARGRERVEAVAARGKNREAAIHALAEESRKPEPPRRRPWRPTLVTGGWISEYTPKPPEPWSEPELTRLITRLLGPAENDMYDAGRTLRSGALLPANATASILAAWPTANEGRRTWLAGVLAHAEPNRAVANLMIEDLRNWHRNFNGLQSACLVLQAHAPFAAEAVPVLNAILATGDPSAVRVVEQTLRAIGPSAASAVPLLFSSAARLNGSFAVPALISIGEPAMPAALDLIETGDDAERLAGFDVVLGVNPELGEALAAKLLEHDTSAAVRAATIYPIAKHAEGNVSLLVHALDDPSADVRSRAAWALRRVGPQVVPDLVRLLERPDEDERVVTNAVYALESLARIDRHVACALAPRAHEMRASCNDAVAFTAVTVFERALRCWPDAEDELRVAALDHSYRVASSARRALEDAGLPVSNASHP